MTSKATALVQPPVAANAVTSDYDARLARVERVSRWLDGRWRVPGTRFAFGWDGLIGMIPGIGDLAGLGCSLYLVHEAIALGVPVPAVLRMLFNIAVDGFIGMIPLAGDIFDFGWKANIKNAAVIRQHALRLAGERAGFRSAGKVVRFAVLLVLGSIVLTIGLTTGFVYLLVAL